MSVWVGVQDIATWGKRNPSGAANNGHKFEQGDGLSSKEKMTTFSINCIFGDPFHPYPSSLVFASFLSKKYFYFSNEHAHMHANAIGEYQTYHIIQEYSWIDLLHHS